MNYFTGFGPRVRGCGARIITVRLIEVLDCFALSIIAELDSYYLNVTDPSPFTQLRLVYLHYQKMVNSNSPSVSALAISALHQDVINQFQIVLDSITPETPMNLMVTSYSQAILTGNSYFCLNHGVVGVIIPFYGSSSFINPEILSKTEKEESTDADLLVQALTENASNAYELFLQYGSSPEFIDELCEKTGLIPQLTKLLIEKGQMVEYYTTLISKLSSEGNVHLTSFVTALHRHVIQEKIQSYDFNLQLALLLLQLHQIDTFVSYFASLPPELLIPTLHSILPLLLQLAAKQYTDFIHIIAQVLSEGVNQWKAIHDFSKLSSFLQFDGLKCQQAAEIARQIIKLMTTYILLRVNSFALLFDSIYIVIVLAECIAEANPEIISGCFQELFNDSSPTVCPIQALYHILFVCQKAHSFFARFGSNNCCGLNDAFLLFELSLLSFCPPSLLTIFSSEISQVIRCSLGLQVGMDRVCTVDAENAPAQCVEHLRDIHIAL